MSRSTLRLALAGLLATATTMLQAQLDPAARLLSNATAAQAPLRGQTSTSDAMVSVYVVYTPGQTDWQAIQALGGHVGVRSQGLATVRLPLSGLGSLADVQGITYVQAPQQAHLALDLARSEAFADLAQALPLPSSPEALPATGRGIVIGQVDAGIDYMHNAFRSADGTLRISRVWEQGTDPSATYITGLRSPEAFGYGAEFDTPELILEAGGDSDAGSHGTHVMGIAAGSDTYLDGQFHGLAPEAELVMVAMNEVGPDNVHVSDAIQYIFDYADAVQKPCVINLSLGGNSGPHDGTSAFDRIADGLQGPGRLIVGAAGNYGADKFHIGRSLDASADAEGFKTLLNHDFEAKRNYGDVDIWADPTLDFSLEMFDYGTIAHGESEKSTLTLAQLLDGEVHEVTFGRNISGTVQLTGETNPMNGKTHILLRSLITSIRVNHLVALRVVPTAGAGQIDLWADNAELRFNAPQYDGFVNPTDESTVCEIGGTANRILSVGAYTTRDEFKLEDDDKIHPAGQTLGDLCTFSGYGPTADGRQKPEVCAPGSVIVSAISGLDLSDDIHMHSHYTDASRHEQRYGYMQGTSMSTPFVTGAVALWLQAYPSLTPEELKEVIALSARQDDFTADTRFWGAGKIDVLAGLERCIELSKQSGIQRVAADCDAEHQLYDLAGRRIEGTPSHGIYILRAGTESRKIQF